MKRHSTGELTKEQHQEQDVLYAQNHTYDYVIIGTGMAALSAGALLANAGKRVCLLEAHDVAGGYAHTFRMGDYFFCAQIHYVWNCAPGHKVYEFLRQLQLEKKITFNLLDPKGYDRMVMPDGKSVMFPYGFDLVAANIEKAYPGTKENVLKFFGIVQAIREEVCKLPQYKPKWWEYLLKAPQFRHLILYRNKTLQDVFDQCSLSPQVQAVLCAQVGNFMAPPQELSIFAYTALTCGYNTGAYYPTKTFKYVVDQLCDSILKHDGCHIYYETPVTQIHVQNGLVSGIVCADGKVFRAQRYLCNMDPQKTSFMIGRDKFPSSSLPALSYEYSGSSLMVYLGLKNIDLKKYGFGSFNTWHLTEWDQNAAWHRQLRDNNGTPWVFIASPTLHTCVGGAAPKGGHILEVATHASYDYFLSLQKKSYKEYTVAKMALGNKLISFVEKNYIPDLRVHMASLSVGSPTTNEDFCLAPRGNAYGQDLTPSNMGLGRLKSATPFSNLWWCNAASGYPGFQGTITTGMQLYMDLTGDRFFDELKVPTDQEMIAAIRKENPVMP